MELIWKRARLKMSNESGVRTRSCSEFWQVVEGYIGFADLLDCLSILLR